MSYIGPMAALAISALLLREYMGTAEIIGEILILGSTVVGEVSFGKKTELSSREKP